MSENWPYWHYKGRVTHPIDIPGVGPIILTPRARFQAPTHAVTNLRRAKLVTRIDPPKETPEPKGQSTAPKEPQAVEVPAPETKRPEEPAGEPVSAATEEPVLASDQPTPEEEGSGTDELGGGGSSGGSRRRRSGRRG